jgi:hypothetical protein
MLLGGDAGHRLEQVGVVRRALFNRPVLHRAGDGVGDGRIEHRAELDRLLQRLEDRLGQALPLHLFIEDINAEEVLDVNRLEVDAIQLMPGGHDRFDRGLTHVGRAHTHSPEQENAVNAKGIRPAQPIYLKVPAARGERWPHRVGPREGPMF